MTRRRLRVLPMGPRNIEEEHRASTPLELLFDLCFVVAVSQAAGQLHVALGVGHFHTGIVGYLMVFFGTWWAWFNFTWFAGPPRPQAAGRITMVVGGAVVVVVIGATASGLGVGVATLLMGVVVAALVVADELRRDARSRPGAATS